MAASELRAIRRRRVAVSGSTGVKGLALIWAVLSWYFENNQPTSEDCLFLDVYVPGKAARGEVKDLSVLNFIYPGGYGKLIS